MGFINIIKILFKTEKREKLITNLPRYVNNKFINNNYNIMIGLVYLRMNKTYSICIHTLYYIPVVSIKMVAFISTFIYKNSLRGKEKLYTLN